MNNKKKKAKLFNLCMGGMFCLSATIFGGQSLDSFLEYREIANTQKIDNIKDYIDGERKYILEYVGFGTFSLILAGTGMRYLLNDYDPNE